ncbi:OPT family oligopeptide transporter [Roseiterribacter gracilis]|uniref:Oligopeptide transporter, OPT family protein n=1 Tax=Roseiterribacter gracilis TaxID=2812848 RepID=A0A8S8XHE9_9PROT|nr:oligopeptide transporter, OPT family protein [Rhodospirillales bacterium TMPK1]
MTLRGLLLGAAITVVFTAANVYLGLRVGTTVSSSISAAVISMAILRFAPGHNVLENNIVQTVASAAGTLSSIIFVMPGLLMVGHWNGFPFWLSAGICAVGGILGVAYTVPLRRAMVVEGGLPYPEGVAAAEILRAGSTVEADGPRAKNEPGVVDIVRGAIASAAFGIASGGFRLISEDGLRAFKIGPATGIVGCGFSFALLGVGWLISISVGLAILLGVVIAWGVAVPILTVLIPTPDGTDLAAHAVGLWRTRVRFIGAGTMTVAAVWSLVVLAKPLADGVRASLRALAETRAGRGDAVPRVERDLPFDKVMKLALALAVPMAALFIVFVQDAYGFTRWDLVIAAILFSFILGLLVAATCGYMAGIIGSSHSPISGIGIVAMLAVALMLYLLDATTGGTTTKPAVALALFIVSMVLAIATIANDNLQDLKTGQLVGATPWKQQVALMIGVVVGAAVIPPVLDLLHQAYGFTGALPRPDMDPRQVLAAPQATIISSLAKGVLGGELDWTYLSIGFAIGVALILIDSLGLRRFGLRLPVLAVGLGIYLALSTTTPTVIGAVLAHLARRHARRTRDEAAMARAERRGVLVASGLIVGESLIGVALAALIVGSGSAAPLALAPAGFQPTAEALGLVAFCLCGTLLWRAMAKR